jgi:hypothetical protein
VKVEAGGAAGLHSPPRRRKEAGGGKRLSLAAPSLSPPASLSPAPHQAANTFSRALPELHTGHVYSQVGVGEE